MVKLGRSYRCRLVGLLAAGFFFSSGSYGFSQQSSGYSDFRTAISQAAKINIPAVVHIEAVNGEEVLPPRVPFESDPLLHYSYTLLKPPGKGTHSAGTGVIIDHDGNILTTYHLVGGATEIAVFLESGKRYPATLVGLDPKTDLAVIHIAPPEPLPCVTFGNSDKLDVGEWVIALGRARDNDPVVTQGIIRARHRRGVTDPGTFKDLLQTDATVNSGYCGGPLLNLRGEVIGINSALVSEAADLKGVSFAFPGNLAFHVAKTLVDHGKVERGWLGLRIQEVTPENIKQPGTKRGALVTEVIPGGPADKAGLQKGDIITEYGDEKIEDVAALRSCVSRTPVDQAVRLGILREGNEESVTVHIGRAGDLERTFAALIKDHLGADVRPVTADEACKFNIQPNHGVMITWIDSQGPFGQVGFEVGDVIIEMNGHTVKNLESFLPLVRSLEPAERITIYALDHRSGHKGYVQIKMR
jgi:serine protease Do